MQHVKKLKVKWSLHKLRHKKKSQRALSYPKAHNTTHTWTNESSLCVTQFSLSGPRVFRLCFITWQLKLPYCSHVLVLVVVCPMYTRNHRSQIRLKRELKILNEGVEYDVLTVSSLPKETYLWMNGGCNFICQFWKAVKFGNYPITT